MNSNNHTLYGKSNTSPWHEWDVPIHYGDRGIIWAHSKKEWFGDRPICALFTHFYWKFVHGNEDPELRYLSALEDETKRQAFYTLITESWNDWEQVAYDLATGQLQL